MQELEPAAQAADGNPPTMMGEDDLAELIEEFPDEEAAGPGSNKPEELAKAELKRGGSAQPCNRATELRF